MRVLCLLFLLPLGALASCPAGLKLSNVPIATALPFCVKWESSSLGGCQVTCPGVCVEFPIEGTKGPIETTGSECKLGGGDGGDGGDGEGGETGGGENPDPGNGGFSTPPKLVGEMNIGGDNITNIASGFNSLLNESWWIKSGIGDIRNNSFNLNTHAISIQENTDKMVSSLKFLSDKTVESSDKLDNNFKSVLDALGSGGAGSPGEGDAKIYDELSQFHLDMFGPGFAQNNVGASMYGQLRSMTYDIQSMGGRTHEMASDIHNFYTYALPELRDNSSEMNRNIRSIAEAIKNGGGGSEGGSSGGDIDYSKMPGSADNPLQMAGAEYKSSLCQGGDGCAFDLAAINKQYDESKEKLKDAHKGIKTEVADIFKFQFSGTGSVPKCFEMFSLFGNSYSVCPAVGDYWEVLAAIMLFVFYFIALMIVVRR